MQVQSRFSILRQVRDWARRTKRCPCCGGREGVSDGNIPAEKKAGGGQFSRRENSGNRRQQVSVEQILTAVSATSKIDIDTLLSKQRTKIVVRWRRFAYLLCRDLRGMSFPEIGKTFKRDHTSVLYGIGKITMAINEDAEVAEMYEGLVHDLS